MTGHVPVLVREVVEAIAPVARTWVVDCTLGLGGHSEAILAATGPEVRVLGLDVDEGNLARARDRLAGFGDRWVGVRSNFSRLAACVAEAGIAAVDAVLADLGVSSNQLADGSAGLSFEVDGPLDMRLDRREALTAAALVNELSEEALADLLYLQGEEHRSRRIARRICEARRTGPVVSTVALARLVTEAVGGGRRERIHPATRTFLALRSAVNRERESLSALLAQAPGVVRPGGRIAIISFQSLEDRPVKESFRRWAASGVGRLVTRKPVVADREERTRNPRSRSAKLRVFERASSRPSGEAGSAGVEEHRRIEP